MANASLDRLGQIKGANAVDALFLKLGISELGEGIYLYHLRNGKNAETGRILVQH